MTDCIFCKIIRGEIPSYKVFEDDSYVAILDIFPKTPGMVLLMPKTHTPSYLLNVADSEISAIIAKAKLIAKNMDEKLPSILRTTFLFEGIDVDHLHLKLIPFYKDTLKDHKQPEMANKQDLENTANLLKESPR